MMVIGQIMPTMRLVLITSISICGALFLVFKIKKESQKLPINPENMLSVRLMNLESSYYFVHEMEPIKTATFFNGTVPLQILQDRVNKVIKANPWLAGRLVQHEEGLCLEFPKHIGDIDFTLYFREETDGKGSLDFSKNSYNDISNGVTASEAGLKNARDCVDKDEPLFRVTVVHMKSSHQFAIVVSLNHVVGDGYTYYKIMNMLSMNCDVKSLNAERKHFYDSMREELNGEIEKDQMKNFIALKFSRFRCLAFSPKYTVEMFDIDPKCISQMKSDFQKEIATKHNDSNHRFISTNDIITSTFLKMAKPKLGIMAINFRNRVPNICNDDAGNYEDGVFFRCPEDVQTPLHIRKAVTPNPITRQYIRAPIDEETNKFSVLPGFWERACSRSSIITNWSSFDFEEFVLPDCKQILHMPTFILAGVDACVIFKPRPKEYAVFVSSLNFHPTDVYGDDSGGSGLFKQKTPLRKNLKAMFAK